MKEQPDMKKCKKCGDLLKPCTSSENPGKVIWLHVSLKPCVKKSGW
jgi:hypothetical protein